MDVRVCRNCKHLLGDDSELFSKGIWYTYLCKASPHEPGKKNNHTSYQFCRDVACTMFEPSDGVRQSFRVWCRSCGDHYTTTKVGAYPWYSRCPWCNSTDTSPHVMESQVATHSFSVDDNGIVRVFPAFKADTPNPLLHSIRKWKFMVGSFEASDTIVRDGGHDTCALCVVHGDGCRSWHHSTINSVKCPIFKFIGTHECRNTPYVWWTRTKSLASAKAELAFLLEVQEFVDEHATRGRWGKG